MGSWNEHCLTCMHGIQEHADYHDCPKCKEIAEKQGLKWIDGKQTYIYLKKPKQKNK